MDLRATASFKSDRPPTRRGGLFRSSYTTSRVVATVMRYQICHCRLVLPFMGTSRSARTTSMIREHDTLHLDVSSCAPLLLALNSRVATRKYVGSAYTHDTDRMGLGQIPRRIRFPAMALCCLHPWRLRGFLRKALLLASGPGSRSYSPYAVESHGGHRVQACTPRYRRTGRRSFGQIQGSENHMLFPRNITLHSAPLRDEVTEHRPRVFLSCARTIFKIILLLGVENSKANRTITFRDLFSSTWPCLVIHIGAGQELP
jgi:hypothetical protein